MPELTQEEYDVIEPIKATYNEQDAETFEYIGGDGVTHEIKKFDAEVGIKWVDVDGIENRRRTIRVEAPTVYVELFYYDEDFKGALTRFINPIEGNTYIIKFDYYVFVSDVYFDGVPLLYSGDYLITLPMATIENQVQNINLKLNGVKIQPKIQESNKTQIVSSGQIFARSALIYTTDLSHPKNAEWVDLAARVSTCCRDTFPTDPTDEDLEAFHINMADFAKEINLLLLPGETF